MSSSSSFFLAGSASDAFAGRRELFLDRLEFRPALLMDLRLGSKGIDARFEPDGAQPEQLDFRIKTRDFVGFRRLGELSLQGAQNLVIRL